ncbi:hypothetical protein [Streptomyces sp. UNOC14_S4]|uniref:hypothetical protein n=1 Tax=Streptomyces sp. UNOC14_S4 TaxID=2872340 RepID=UPI001E58AEC1|nr:hypothetical protein [Streptomyces sp. UNOC14_S4]MCC3766462.1 hypothetical protein [Streptomyces sp. UNOC14_S4]
MSRKPLFAGLSTDDPKSSEIYSETFKQQQRQESANAHLKTPLTPPSHRPRHTADAGGPEQVFIPLVTTRSSKYGIRESTGTPSVPAGLRKSDSESTPSRLKARARKRRAGDKARYKDAEKIIYNGHFGMTARRSMTREEHADLAARSLAQAVVTQISRENERVKNAACHRAEAKRRLNDAIGRERDALARGDKNAAEMARADVRRFRKESQYREV